MLSVGKSRQRKKVELPAVNRNALTIDPTAVYLEWVKTCPKIEPDLTLEDLLDESTVYLIPEVDDDPEEWLKKKYSKILEEELEGWCSEPIHWPKDRSFKTFKEFFKVSYSSIVFDMDKQPIKREPTI